MPDTAALHQSSIAEAYESLRDQRGASSRWGSVVLMRRGMLAWMGAHSARLAAPSHPPDLASAGSVSPPRPAVSLKREVTDIVANMVIAAGMVSR